jgi:mannosidase alpha-like ER degradation enhancer 1
MHSFALSETLKYAYLILCVADTLGYFFADRKHSDESNPFNLDDSSMVYTTEGHLLPLCKRYLPKHSPSVTSESSFTCDAYDPLRNGKPWTPLLPGVQHRQDADWARLLVGLELDEEKAIREGIYSIYGRCEKPTHEDYVRLSEIWWLY